MRVLLIIASLLLFQNCGTDQLDKIRRTYRLVNGTEREVRIDIYERGDFWFTRVSDGMGVIFEGESSNDAGGTISASGSLIGDSIIVTYDNSKTQTYYFNETVNSIPKSDRNIFLDEDYDVISNELYEFTFTEADYENAKEN